MSRIINDDRDGNYLVEIFDPKKRVNSFQTRTFEDAVEEAWQVFRGRQNSTARITGRVTVCRVWRPSNGHGWRVTDQRNITEQMFERWHKLWEPEETVERLLRESKMINDLRTLKGIAERSQLSGIDPVVAFSVYINEFIPAFDPATCLELLEEVERLRAKETRCQCGAPLTPQGHTCWP